MIFGDWTVARRLWVQVRPYRRHVAGAFLVSAAATPLALLLPVPLKVAVDSILGGKPLPAFVRIPLDALGVAPSSFAEIVAIAAWLVAITVLVYVQGLLAWTYQTWLGETLVLNFRATLLRHAQRLSLAYHDRAGTMDAVYRIQYDADSLQFVVVTGLLPLISATLMVAGMIVVTAAIDAPLAWVTLAACPCLYWVADHYGERLRRRWVEVKDLDSAAMSLVQEVLAGLRVVKAFGREDYEHGRFLERSGRRFAGQLDVARIKGQFDLAVGATIAVATGMALIVGVRHVQAGRLTIGELLLVMSYLAQIYEPLKTMSKKVGDVQAGLVSVARALTLLDELPEVPERAHPQSIQRARGELVFDRVSFAFPGRRPILREFSLRIAPGTRVGIAGASGAGKTTLIGLLTRFDDPVSGRIFLDGVDLREYRLADLRRQFSIVLQDPMLFSASIAENIAYGRPEAPESEIVDAARAANAHDFITRLPEGYRAEVGERGMRLSGGERQRISIARAFLKQAPVLLLDEPTSAVDNVAEVAIVDAIDRLMHGRTVFLVAHRLSTLERCDVRLTLADGYVGVETDAAAAASDRPASAGPTR